MSREATLIKARDELIKAGLMEYQKGKKGTPNRYRMISFFEKNTFKSEVQSVVENVVQTVVESEVQSVVESVDINKHKTKNNKKSSTDVLPEKTDAFSDQLATIRELYNSVCGSYPRLVKMSEARKKAVRARLRAGYTVEDFRRLFEMAEASSFLKGQNNRNWTATFDWLIADANMAKVLDGNYKDKPQSSAYSSAKDAETAAWSKHRDYYGRAKNRFHNCESHGYDYEDILEQMGGFYEAENTEEHREQLEEIQADEAIWPETIARFRKSVAPGVVYYYRDEEGVRRRTKVTDTRCPHICLFDNGQAYSWADVIRCSRKGTHTLGEWPK